VSKPAAPAVRPPPANVVIIAPTIKFRVVLVTSFPTSFMEAGTADENWHSFKRGRGDGYFHQGCVGDLTRTPLSCGSTGA